MDSRTRIARLLPELEVELRARDLWSAHAPPPQALASTQPFCVDTLAFEQWLQFVFLPRVEALLAAGAALPAGCAIAAMGEIRFTDRDHAALIALLRAIDEAWCLPPSA
ncbi:MAG: putative protein YqcC [Pseudomonadales bacterium]|nr:putative protein YqcC [Pseudomonadales bacterium]